MTNWKSRAEAAELALQHLRSAMDKVHLALGEDVASDDETAAEGITAVKAALQAKEQELAESRLNHIDANERNIKAEDTAAQARQQAVEDCWLAYESHYHSAIGRNDDGCAECDENFRHPIHLRVGETKESRIAALTPPPALTLDVNRCAVCGWTLSETAEKGCVRGNCSLRPRPANLYDPERAAAERLVPPALTKEK